MPNTAVLSGVQAPATPPSRVAGIASRGLIALTVISAAVAFFVIAGLLFAPLLGLQTDEVMFAKAWWDPTGCVSWVSIYHHRFPSMMMSYLGGLKSWLYAPLLSVLPISVWLIRVPAILAAAASILLAGRLLYRIESRGANGLPWFAAGCIACLLATDDTILLTSVFDWGPVVLQNLLLIAALLVFQKFYRQRRSSILFLAGLVLGLNLWNKALFIWNFSAMAVALLIFGFPAIRRVWSWRRCAVLALAIVTGGFPLFRFNLSHRATTVTENSHSETCALIQLKAEQTARYLNGLAAQSALVDMETKAPDRVSRPFTGPSLAVWNWTGRHFSSWMCWAGTAFLLLGSVFARPLQRRWIGFFFVSAALGWLECILTRGAGLSIHHAVLFFLPWYLAVALSMSGVAAAGRRWARVAIVVCLVFFCTRAIMATTVCYADMLTYESGLPWTNADTPLVSDLLRSGVKRIIATDWGISDVVSTRSRGRINVDMRVFSLAGGDWFDPELYLNCSAPECAIVSHVPPRYSSASAAAFFDASLSKYHLVRTDETVFRDTHGIATLMSFRVRPAAEK